jgi:hypothetical protein
MNGQNDSMAMIRNLAHNELSVKARLGYVALLLAATGMTVVIGSLWISEIHLPVRTQLAFAVMSVIGASWAALAVWVLTTRRVLFALDRVIAGRMAVTFSGLFAAGALVAAIISGRAAAFGAVAAGVVMLLVAARVLVGARRRFTELAARRAELERALGETSN